MTQLAGIRHVRATAQIDKVTLAIERNLVALGNAGNDFRLVLLAVLAEILHRLATLHDLATNRNLVLDDAAHLGRDTVDILRGKTLGIGKVVVEPVVDHRTNGHLRPWKQALYGLRQQMRGGVADNLEPFLVFRGNDAQAGITFHFEGSITQGAIHFARQRGLGQPRANIRRHLGDGYWMIVCSLTAIGQCNRRHDGSRYLIVVASLIPGNTTKKGRKAPFRNSLCDSPYSPGVRVQVLMAPLYGQTHPE